MGSLTLAGIVLAVLSVAVVLALTQRPAFKSQLVLHGKGEVERWTCERYTEDIIPPLKSPATIDITVSGGAVYSDYDSQCLTSVSSVAAVLSGTVLPTQRAAYYFRSEVAGKAMISTTAQTGPISTFLNPLKASTSVLVKNPPKIPVCELPFPQGTKITPKERDEKCKATCNIKNFAGGPYPWLRVPYTVGWGPYDNNKAYCCPAQYQAKGVGFPTECYYEP